MKGNIDMTTGKEQCQVTFLKSESSKWRGAEFFKQSEEADSFPVLPRTNT